MHIAYITSEYPHSALPPAGGIGSFVKTMADSLVKENHQVTVFLCFSDEDKEWYDGQIRIVQIRKSDLSKISVLTNRIRINKVINRYIKQYNIQLVEAPDWEGIHAFCSFNVPLITRIHGSVTYFNTLESRKPSTIIRFLEKRALQKSTAVVAVSNFAGKTTGEVFALKGFNYTTIYNGIDTSKFVNTENITEENTILYFGTLIRKKGVLEIPYILEKVLERVPHAKLILAGKDAVDPIEKISTWQLMQDKISEKAMKNVTYLGAVPYHNISELIKKSRLCVFPSFAEAFPISWLEAMALGKALITSNIGWANESIEDYISGFLIDPRDHTTFAEKIIEVLSEDVLAKQLGENARERVVQLFDQKEILKQNLDFYKRLIL